MVSRPTLSSLIAAAESDIDGKLTGADSRLRRSMLSVIVRVLCGLAFALYGFIIANWKNLFIDSADDAHVLEQAADYGLSLTPASFAGGNIDLTGADGNTVLSGAALQYQDAAGNILQYTTTADATIAGGVAVVAVAASQGGVASNLAAGTILTFVSPVAGVSSSATVAAGGVAGGVDQETIDSLRARVKQRKRNPPQGGSQSDYEQWVSAAISGITRSWVIPGWDGVGSVGLGFVFDRRTNIIPTSDDLTAMSTYIAPLRPVTARVVPFAPIASPIDFTLTISPDNALLRTAVEGSLADLIVREGTAEGGAILLSHMRDAIGETAGIDDYALTAPAADVVTAAGYLPTFGGVTGW
jgi:uncharacterized phage protein gp47/JayE